MSQITYYHNPRCSKSRKALALLEETGANLKIVPYLTTPPTLTTLKAIASALHTGPRGFMRSNEAIYKELGLGRKDLSDDALFKAIVDHPKLLERPIAVSGKRAVIGRPPEDILKILK